MATVMGMQGAGRPNIGLALSNGFALVGRRPAEMFSIAFLLGGLPNALLKALSSHFAGTPLKNLLFISLGNLLVVAIAATIGYGLITRLVVSSLDGADEPAGRSVDQILRRLPMLLAMGLLQNLGIALGMIGLLVPGLMLMAIWGVAVQAASMERLGPIEGLQRSRFLTRGARWQMFGLIVILGIAGALGGYLINLIATSVYGSNPLFITAVRGSLPIGYFVMLAAYQMVLVAISASVQASFYKQLRDWKDGPQTDTLAEVFA